MAQLLPVDNTVADLNRTIGMAVATCEAIVSGSTWMLKLVAGEERANSWLANIGIRDMNTVVQSIAKDTNSVAEKTINIAHDSSVSARNTTSMACDIGYMKSSMEGASSDQREANKEEKEFRQDQREANKELREDREEQKRDREEARKERMEQKENRQQEQAARERQGEFEKQCLSAFEEMTAAILSSAAPRRNPTHVTALSVAGKVLQKHVNSKSLYSCSSNADPRDQRNL